MINKIQSSPSFGSTQIRILPSEHKQFIGTVVDKYLLPLRKPGTFIIDGRGPKTPQKIADNMSSGNIACTITTKGKSIFINVFGKNEEADKKIGDTLTGLFKNAKFTKDIK